MTLSTHHVRLIQNVLDRGALTPGFGIRPTVQVRNAICPASPPLAKRTGPVGFNDRRRKTPPLGK
jgi:hypothetical protein